MLDAQLDLIRWAQGPDLLRWARFVSTNSVEYRLLDHVDEARAVNAVRASLDGWTLWVSADIAAILEHAQVSMPPPDQGAISAGVIPHPAGMAWIAGDPAMIYFDHPIVAVSWLVTLWPGTVAATGEVREVPSVVVFPWRTGDGPLPEILPPTVLPLAPDAAQMIDLDPDEVTAGAMEWDAEEWAGDPFALDRWMLATWVFAAQVLPQHIVSASRPARRRAGRILGTARPDWGDVHVMTLRTMRRGGGEGVDDEDGPHHSHRWVVRGHWRWQPCGPGRKDRRLTWVRPHIKGPDDAPLIEIDQVAKLTR